MKCLNSENQKVHTCIIIIQMHIEYIHNILAKLTKIVIIYRSIFFWNPIFRPLTPCTEYNKVKLNTSAACTINW
jgi:hypothetical protein